LLSGVRSCMAGFYPYTKKLPRPIPNSSSTRKRPVHRNTLQFWSRLQLSHLHTLYTQSKRITHAPFVLPRLLARSWPALYGITTDIIFVIASTLQKTVRIRHACILTGSEVTPLPKILHCCPPQRLGPCLSSDVADQSPKSTTHHRLGEPLPTPTTTNPPKILQKAV